MLQPSAPPPQPEDRPDAPPRPSASWRPSGATLIAAGLALVASAYLTLLFYPGVLYSDSYERWRIAAAILEGAPIDSYLSVGPSLWMAATYALTDNFAAYTMLQAFVYLFTTLLVVAAVGELAGGWILLPAAALLAFPLFPGYAVYQEGGVGVAIGLNGLVLAALWTPAPRRRLAAALRVVAVFAALFTVFTYRQNAITILPAVAVLAWKASGAPRIRLAFLGATVAAVVAASAAGPALGVRGGGPGPGLAWEIARTLKRVQKPEYASYLDYVGSTRGALQGDLEDAMWPGLISEQALSFDRLHDPRVAGRLRSDYLRLARSEPGAFLANKWSMARRTLGLGKPLVFAEFDENRWNEMPGYGWRNTLARHLAFERVRAAVAPATLRMPWVVLAAALAALAVGRFALRRGPRLGGTIVTLGACYYGAFLVTTQAFEFRYFFPAFHVAAVLLLAVAAQAARAGWRRLRPAPAQGAT